MFGFFFVNCWAFLFILNLKAVFIPSGLRQLRASEELGKEVQAVGVRGGAPTPNLLASWQRESVLEQSNEFIYANAWGFLS